MIAQEAAGGEVEDLLAFDRRIKRKAELIERFEFAEIDRFDSAFNLTLVANVEFILQHEFQELDVAEFVACGFLQSHVERLGQKRPSSLRTCMAINHSASAPPILNLRRIRLR